MMNPLQKIGWSARLSIACVVAVIVTLTSYNTVGTKEQYDYALGDCAFQQKRTRTAEERLLQQAAVYDKFSVDWDRHGFHDIAIDWALLALNDRTGETALEASTFLPNCSPPTPRPGVETEYKLIHAPELPVVPEGKMTPIPGVRKP